MYLPLRKADFTSKWNADHFIWATSASSSLTISILAIIGEQTLSKSTLGCRKYPLAINWALYFWTFSSSWYLVLNTHFKQTTFLSLGSSINSYVPFFFIVANSLLSASCHTLTLTVSLHMMGSKRLRAKEQLSYMSLSDLILLESEPSVGATLGLISSYNTFALE